MKFRADTLLGEVIVDVSQLPFHSLSVPPPLEDQPCIARDEGLVRDAYLRADGYYYINYHPSDPRWPDADAMYVLKYGDKYVLLIDYESSVSYNDYLLTRVD